MGVIWILENPNTAGPRLVDQLMGAFAVRAFASIESLEIVLRCMTGAHPSVVVASDIYHDRLRYILPASVKILASDGNSPEGLTRSVQAILSRCDKAEQSILKFRSVTLNTRQRKLRVEGEDIEFDLPSKESEILAILIAHRGRVVARNQLADVLWSGTKVSARTLDSHISRLRQKLDGSDVTLEAVYGAGYILR